MSAGTGALSGAASGAAMGSVAGPWGMAIGAVVGAVMGAISGGEEEKAQAKAYKQQVAAISQNYNFGNQQVDADLVTARDLAAAELGQTQTNSIQNQASIRAAVHESGMEGNSMERVMRIAKGADLRAEDSVRDGFGKAVAGALLSKQINRTNAQSALKAARTSSQNAQGSTAGQMVNLVGQGLQAYSQYSQIQSYQKQTKVNADTAGNVR